MVRINLRNTAPARLRAFTLVELVVVTGIMVLVSGVVLANNNRFGGTVQLENLTYDIALSIRQAQVFGISVQRSDTGINCSDLGARCFEKAYGMHFDTLSVANQTNYEFFTDINGDGFFDAANPPPKGENVSPSPYTIRSGFKISHLCAPEGADAATCPQVSQLDIVFKRPEADAWISAGGIPCAYGVGTCAESARIVLTSPRGDVMSVMVGANGQISVRREPSQ